MSVAPVNREERAAILAGAAQRRIAESEASQEIPRMRASPREIFMRSLAHYKESSLTFLPLIKEVTRSLTSAVDITKSMSSITFTYSPGSFSIAPHCSHGSPINDLRIHVCSVFYSLRPLQLSVALGSSYFHVTHEKRRGHRPEISYYFVPENSTDEEDRILLGTTKCDLDHVNNTCFNHIPVTHNMSSIMHTLINTTKLANQTRVRELRRRSIEILHTSPPVQEKLKALKNEHSQITALARDLGLIWDSTILTKTREFNTDDLTLPFLFELPEDFRPCLIEELD